MTKEILSGYNYESEKKFKDFRAEKNEAPLSLEQSIDKFTELLKSTKKLLLITDLDGTIVPFEKDPVNCKINKNAKLALEKIKSLGVEIAVMTGRSGKDGAFGPSGINIPGAIIIGNSGWEIFKIDNPQTMTGKSIVNEKLTPYRELISNFLGNIENNFINFCKTKNKSAANFDNTINLPDGKIYFNKDSVNDNFDHGVTIKINLNSIAKDKWPLYKQVLINLYNQYLPKELKDIYQLKITQIDKMPSTLSISISPFGEEGKHESLVQLLRSNEDKNPITGEYKRKETFRNNNIPGGFDGVIYFGDTNQDAKAIRAAHLSAAIAGRKSAGVVIINSDSQIGVQDKAIRYADVGVNKIEENAKLLEKIAKLAEQYYKK